MASGRITAGQGLRYTDLIDTKTGLEAAWNMGCAHGKREERRKQEITRGASLRVVEN